MDVSDMYDEDDENRLNQGECHHCYGWSANDRCLNCGKDMVADYSEYHGMEDE